jgi:hypothetical protein
MQHLAGDDGNSKVARARGLEKATVSFVRNWRLAEDLAF